MEEFSALLRGDELRREAEAWRRSHAGARPVSARVRFGRSLVHLGERLIEG